MAQTTSSADLEILAADGSTWVPLMLAAIYDTDGNPQAKTLNESLVASDSDAQLSEWLESVVKEDWSGGFGIDYSAAIALDTWSTPGYVLPEGACTDVTVNATQNSASPLVAFCEFGGDLWIAQQGTGVSNSARILRSSGGTGALSNSLNLAGAGEYMRDLLVADDGSGNKVLWASSSSVTGASGCMHKWDGSSWTRTAVGDFGTWGRNGMKAVFWVDEEGIGATRIVTASSNQGHISYLRPYGNPMTPADWVEGVRTTATTRVELAAARRHVYMRDLANVYDLDEQGNSPALLSENTTYYGTGPAVEYMDGYVYYSHGTGLARVRVDQGAVLQEAPGTSSPGYLTPTKSPYATGYCTALLPHQGFMLAAMYCPVTGVPVVFRGRDASLTAVTTPNPMVWHGPTVVGSEAAVITRMHVSTLAATPSQTRLYLASWHTNQVSFPKLAWISQPSVAGPIADIQAGGSHRYANGAGSALYNRTSRFEALPDTVGDKASAKFAYQHSYGTEGLNDPVGTKLTVYQRFDAAPGSSSWGAGTDIPTGPAYDLTPTTSLSGNKFEQRIDFFSPNGGSTPPKIAILDSLRSTFWRTAPSFDSWTLDVEYGAEIVDLHGVPWKNSGRSVQWVTDALVALCRGGRTKIRDREDHQWYCKLKQRLPRSSDLHEEEYGRNTTARITLAILGPAT